ELLLLKSPLAKQAGYLDKRLRRREFYHLIDEGISVASGEFLFGGLNGSLSLSFGRFLFSLQSGSHAICGRPSVIRCPMIEAAPGYHNIAIGFERLPLGSQLLSRLPRLRVCLFASVIMSRPHFKSWLAVCIRPKAMEYKAHFQGVPITLGLWNEIDLR